MRPTEEELKDSRSATTSTLSGLLASLRRNQVLRDRAYFSITPFQSHSPPSICWAGGPQPQAPEKYTCSAGVDATRVQGKRPRTLTQRSQGTGAGNPRIVVVDEEARVRAFLKDLLTRKGYTVSVTADPKRGLKMLMGQNPALVILGLKRSETDGLDLLRKMKTYDEMMPVIVTTHPVNIKLAKEGVRLGAFDYVLKPFDPAYMGALVENALEQSPVA
ncbi:MAG: response regulator [bacterium]|nr:response regulator [bacterium]